MTSVSMSQGQCLCGAVTLQTKSLPKNTSACHCGTCHKWTGGPWFTVNCQQDLTVEGREFVSVYSSSEWAERAFCKKCGTHLYYKLLPNSTYYVSTGVLNSSKLEFDLQIFIDKKQPYYSLSESTQNLTEEEFLKIYGGG